MTKHAIIAEGTLSAQEQKFADTYLTGKSAEVSAIAAGYSERSARTTGPRLLRRAAIASYIAGRQNLAAKRAESLEAKLIAELEALAFSNIEDMTALGDDGQRRIDFSATTRSQLAAVTKIKNKTRRIYNGKGEHIATEEQAEFSLAEKHSPIRTLMQYKNMLRPEEHKVTLDLSDRLLEARARLVGVERTGSSDAEDIVDADFEVAEDEKKPGGRGAGV